MTGLDSELDLALKAMGSSFHVQLIGTFAPDLIWAPADAEAADWLTENSPEFDQFPVKHGNSTIGILLRQGGLRGRTVREVMQPLREGVIVSADMPIAELIPQLCESHYRLVLRGGRLDGLVTQSDLIKLPVRMLLFGLISHLELCLRALIRKRFRGPEWLDLLKSARRRAVRAKLGEFKAARFEPDPLEFSNFSDVVTVLRHQADLDEDFLIKTEHIRKLRNDIAHAKTYISSPQDVGEFVERFNDTRQLIARVTKMLKVPQ